VTRGVSIIGGGGWALGEGHEGMITEVVAPPATVRAGARVPFVLRGRVLLAAAVGVAALSLLLGRSPTYDVWAWLVWGREIAHLDLDTTAGPAWKPLPIFVDAVLSPAGGAAPALWLLVARAGGLMALGGAARLAYRAAGPWAAVCAVISLITVQLWVGYLLPYGMGEPMLAAFVLWAAERHLQGRWAHAWWLLVAGALLRPELWPFLVGYAGWLVWRHAVRLAAVVAGLALVPLAWFVPQGFGDGDPFRLGQGQVAPGGPLADAHPGLATLSQLPADLLIWTWVGALVGIGYAVADRDRLLLAVTAAGAAWAGLVAAMAQFHLGAGDSRYLVVTHAAAAVLSGAGWVRLVRDARAYLVRRGADVRVAVGVPVAATCAVAGASIPSFVAQTRPLAHEVRHQQGLDQELPRAVTAAGGRDALLHCGLPWVDPLQVTLVAWQLRLRISQVRSLPIPGAPPGAYPGPLLATRNRISDPVTPVPSPFLVWHQTGLAAGHGATWTVLSPCR
jgi:hypothetical protein